MFRVSPASGLILSFFAYIPSSLPSLLKLIPRY